MKQLVIASNNQGKIKEIRSMISGIELLSLKDIGFSEEIPEPYDTFEENALAKAQTIYNFCGKDVFADDSGICANGLYGAPGVFSARYAGANATDDANLQKLLHELEGEMDRSGYYKAVICLIWNGKPHYFEGVCTGTIIERPHGSGGFGYDPVFVPTGYIKSFGELPAAIKHKLSHRGKAIRQMVDFIEKELEHK